MQAQYWSVAVQYGESKALGPLALKMTSFYSGRELLSVTIKGLATWDERAMSPRLAMRGAVGIETEQATCNAHRALSLRLHSRHGRALSLRLHSQQKSNLIAMAARAFANRDLALGGARSSSCGSGDGGVSGKQSTASIAILAARVASPRPHANGTRPLLNAKI